jgi:predicted small lipoprotein YifL
MRAPAWSSSRRAVAALLAFALAACRSIGPATVPRDRIDYMSSLGNSWKEQTLLNIVKLRYGDVPIFLDVTQVIAGYQLQTTVAGGFSAGNSTAGLVGPFVVSGSAAATNTYTDRPTVIYAPLTGVDFLKQLMTPIPPSAILFLLQSGYRAALAMGMTLDSINGVKNESGRPVRRAADPRFTRLVQLMTELQQSGGVETRIERSKDGGEVSLIVFNPGRDPQIEAKRMEIRDILGLERGVQEMRVRYGGYSGKGDEVAMMTRSMLQIMLEVAMSVQIPEADVSGGRAAPGLVDTQPAGGQARPLVRILSGESAPKDAHVAVQYHGRWFWISDTDIQSKYAFASVMLLFSISGTGVKGGAPVVTVPANQ